MLRLIPVVEVRWREGKFDWAPPMESRGWVELDGDISDDDIARIVATLALYNDLASSGSIEDVAQALEKADRVNLPGGLMIRAGDLEIEPGCCSGLEDWREWYDVAPNGRSPWLGHDPDAWVECKPDHAVIWADNRLGDRSDRVSVEYSEIEAALESAHAALVAFTGRLSDWLSKHSPQSAGLSRRFAAAFKVT